MKKIIKLFFMSVLAFCFMVFLSSCKDDEIKLPTNNYEKVKFAFNGVEKSLRNSNSNNSNKSNSLNDSIPYMSYLVHDDIETIYKAMESKDNENPQFEYDEPPFIQFQYLKALYEEVGEDFKFNTKYSYTLNGEIYYDFKTRTDDKKSDNLTQYTWVLSVKINIDDNDIITADVGFDVTYVTGNITRHQKRFANLLLEYDMDDKNPTYTLTMVDIDDLLSYEAEDEKYINAEYDYVDVDKNVIKEWRKFGICSPTELTNYQYEDFIYKYSTLNAYKDNKSYKLTNSYIKDDRLKKAVFLGIGFTSYLSARDSFLNENSVQNEKIKEIVNKFNKILGKDIVNSFVYTGATEKWVKENKEEYQNLFLKVESTSDFTIYDDLTLDKLFNPEVGWTQKGEKQYITIYYKNGEENTLGTYNDLNNFDVRVKTTSYDNARWIDVNTSNVDSFINYIKESGFKGNINSLDSAYNPIGLQIELTFKSNNNLKADFTIELENNDLYKELLKDWNLVTNYINNYAPIKDAIPEFIEDSDVCFGPEYNINNDMGRINLYSDDDLKSKVEDYINLLRKEEFIENTSNSTYKKRLTDDCVLILTIYVPENKNVKTCSIDFEFQESQAQEKSIKEAIEELLDNGNITVPEYGINSEYTVEDNIINIKESTGYYVNDYVASLEEYGFNMAESGGRFAYKYDAGILYFIHDLGYSMKVGKVKIELSLVGDFNGWNEKDQTYDMNPFYTFDEYSFTIDLDANQKFKIVKNHSWSDGGYGFNLFSGSEEFNPKEYRGDDDDNIIALEGGKYQVIVKIGFDVTSTDINKNDFTVLMIDVIKIVK